MDSLKSNLTQAQRIQALFSRISSRYDLINDIQSFGLHRIWKRRLVKLGNLKPGHKVLDLCCGTGDLAGIACKESPNVVGVDFSAPMLRLAQTRTGGSASRNGSLNSPSSAPVWVQADSLKIPFQPDSFEMVMMGYGLRNLSNVREGLQEALRVIKPGGRVLILDFGKPDWTVWRFLFFCYLRWMVPVYGKVFCGDAKAYAYILDSLKRYPGQRGVALEMSALGLENIKVINLLGGIMGINYGEKAVC